MKKVHTLDSVFAMGEAPAPGARPSLAGSGEVFFGVSSGLAAGPSLVLRAGTGAGGESPLSPEGAAERVVLLDADVAIGGAAREGAGLALAAGTLGVDLPLALTFWAVEGVAVPEEAAA